MGWSFENVIRELENFLGGSRPQTDLNKAMQAPQQTIQGVPAQNMPGPAPEDRWWDEEDEEEPSLSGSPSWMREIYRQMVPQFPSRNDQSSIFRNTKQGRRDIMEMLDEGTSYEGTRYE